MLVTYHGIVRDGKIELADMHLPDGAEVVVITQLPLSSVDKQKRRLAALSETEWRQPFETYWRLLQECETEADIESLSDEQINSLVHEVRQN
ncbi:MAG TPA: hypothetical protein PLD25_08955 [Chloroflexota bacterium]|nr:hypothetical protein [Chloroflexota bacterium]HUM71048.1 hypothetical protein [Chloroflexota bacterium]